MFVRHAEHNGMLGVQEVCVYKLESINNGCHFFIVDVVVLFCGEQRARVECDRMSAICEFLTNDDSKSEVGCIGIHKELFGPIRGAEDWVRAAEILQSVETGLFVCSPSPLVEFLCEVI